MHGDGRVMSKSCVVNERASLARIDQARMTTVVDGGQFAPRRQQHMQDYCDKTEADHDLLLKVFGGEEPGLYSRMLHQFRWGSR